MSAKKPWLLIPLIGIVLLTMWILTERSWAKGDDVRLHSNVSSEDSAAWHVARVDPADVASADDFGQYASVTVDPASGTAYISYYDAKDKNLRMAKHVGSGGNCGPSNSWSCQVVDSEGDVGQYTSIAISPTNGQPAIAYYDADNGALKYISYSCVAGSCQWEGETIDSPGAFRISNDGLYNSLKFDTNGIAHIGYYVSSYFGDDDLMYAHYVGSGGNCGVGASAGKWQCDVIESGNQVGKYASLALNGSNQPRIAYYDGGNRALKYAYSGASGGNCGPGGSWQCYVIDGGGDADMGRYASLHIDKGSSENPHIAYYDATSHRLKYAHYVYSGSNCGPSGVAGFGWRCDGIDDMGQVSDLNPRRVALAVDGNKYPIIAYQDAAEDQSPVMLNVARPIAALGLSEGNCGPLNGWIFQWQCDTVDGGGSWTDEADFVAIATNSAGLPSIAYYETDSYYESGHLKAAYQIDVDPPTNPSTITSSTHIPYVWSSGNIVTVNWSGASDHSGSGIYGYSYAWSKNPHTLPDTTVDTTATSAVSPILEDGNQWWFHIRTRDWAGNWASDAAHYGPFYIDTVPPSSPSTITSDSHTPFVWSSDCTVEVQWSGASDGNGSGIAGYSYNWNEATGTDPDTIIDTTENSTTSPCLDTGMWVFHVRTCDVAGNCSITKDYGIFYIDVARPTCTANSPHNVHGLPFNVSWSGNDEGTGIATYEVQVRDATLETGWKPWKNTPSAGSASFTSGQDGHIYQFRCRATDAIGNVGYWRTPYDSETNVATVDFEVLGMEVTQAVQDLNNSVVLIEGKRTFVRFHVRSTPGDYGPVSAELRAYRDGKWLGTIYPNNSIGVITIRHNPDRQQLDQSFYFDLPSEGTISSWLYGTVRLEATVNRGQHPWAETTHSNNTASVEVSFEHTPLIEIVLFDVFYKVGNTTYHVSNSERIAMESWLRSIFPVPGIKFHWAWMGPYNATLNSNNDLKWPNCSTVNKDMLWHKSHNTLGLNESPVARYYGMVSARHFMRGCAAGIPAEVASGPSWLGGEWYGSHELGHAYGRVHTLGTQPPPCGDCSKCGGRCGCEAGAETRYPNGAISPTQNGSAPNALYGFNIEKLKIYPPSYKDNMSYCNPEWTADYNYEIIHTHIIQEGQHAMSQARPAATQEYLAVFGSIDMNTDQVTLDPFYRVPDAWDVLGREPGDYSIRLLDAQGSILANYPFTPKSTHLDPGPSCRESEPSQVPALITEYVPWMAGTARIGIYHGENELASRSVSAHAPQVTLVTPNGGEALNGDQIHVAWTASDADDDALSFTLDYSVDGGAHWRTLSHGVTTTSLELDASWVPGSNQGKFRVLASDGVNTAQDESDSTFTVPNKPPIIELASPAEGAKYVSGQPVALVAHAMDLEDGTLDDAALSWTSSLSGTLGTGQMLYITDFVTGTHTIVLTATDAGGNSATATRTIYVGFDHDLYLPVVLRR